MPRIKVLAAAFLAAAAAGCGMASPEKTPAPPLADAAGSRTPPAPVPETGKPGEPATVPRPPVEDASAGDQKEAPSASVEVRASAGWVDTKIDVKKGQVIEVKQAGGGWSVDEEHYEKVDADGHADEEETELWNWRDRKYLSDAHFGALIGALDDQEAPFLVGKAAKITAERDGRLFLRINDLDEGEESDNGGAVTVKITISRKLD